MKLFAGWDVGGWHCDKNANSRDALVVLGLSDGALDPVGRPWRGNLRATLMAATGDDLVAAVAEHCDVSVAAGDQVVFAIDTPLGWPSAMMCLAQGGPVSAVSASDGENPYTRRATELALIRRGFAPLSAVRDMLGSQSTKGIHFLRAAGLREASTGVWSRSATDGPTVTAIETYPSVALKLGVVPRLHMELKERSSLYTVASKLHEDVRDALVCAAVAYLFAEEPDLLEPIPMVVPDGEGWIVLPLEGGARCSSDGNGGSKT